MRVSTILFSGLLFFLATNSLAQSAGRDARTLIEELGLEESEMAVSELPFWRKPRKIHIVVRGADAAERALQMKEAQAAVGDVELVQIAYPIPDDVIADAEVLIARCTPRIIREADNLRWLQDSRHGVNSCMTDGSRYESEAFERCPDIEAHRADYEIVSWELEPGDCIFFHGLMLHQGRSNPTKATRRRTVTHRWLGDDATFAVREPISEFPKIDTQMSHGQPFKDVADFPLVWQKAA